MTDPNTDPWVAVQNVQFLRNRFNEPKGLLHAIWGTATGSWEAEAKQQAAGNLWLDQKQQQWEERKSDYLPAVGSAAPVR